MSALEQLHSMVGPNENILWSGRPNLKCFILESIFNPLLPFAFVWALFDGFFIGTIFFATNNAPSTETTPPLLLLVAFFALHLMPVWIYLGGVLFSYLKYKHTAFLVTDKGIYISGGIFAQSFEHKPFTEISHININRGVVDQLLGVGDIVLGENSIPAAPPRTLNKRQPAPPTICDIPDYKQVYDIIKELQQKEHP